MPRPKQHRRVVYRTGAIPANSHAINVPVQMVMLRDYADALRDVVVRMADLALAAGADREAIMNVLKEAVRA